MKVLLDTSVWIRHFRESNSGVVDLLEQQQAVSHMFVVGELACGSLKKRIETLIDLQALPLLPIVSTEEVMHMIESRQLYSRGIGLVDAQLIASVLLTPDSSLWTVDERLERVASDLGISYRSTDS